MRSLVQRVRSASVEVDGEQIASISTGLLVLLGIKEGDSAELIPWMANKLANLRLFPDADDKMNLSVKDVSGSILVVSQFTLYGDAAKGFRPSFIESARPEKAEPLYQALIKELQSVHGVSVQTGRFGAMMDVELVNWGPVTVMIEKEN